MIVTKRWHRVFITQQTAVNTCDTHLQVIGASFTKRQLESECSRLREAQCDRHNATFGEHNATILLQKLHSDSEEERLDERILFVFSPWTCRMQQLPACLLGAVRIDEHPRLRQKIKVVIPAQCKQLTSWWRKSSNMTVGQCSLIYLAHHCYDWHPGSRCG